MHLSPPVAQAAVRSKAVVLLLLTFCLLLLPLWESVIVLCFVVRYFISILILQSSWWGRGSWLLCLTCLPGVSWWLSGSSSRCHGVVCGLWLWYFLIILTNFFYSLMWSFPDSGGIYQQQQHTIWASPRENLSSGVGKQQRRRPACASAQTDQRLCYSFLESIISKLATSEISIF